MQKEMEREIRKKFRKFKKKLKICYKSVRVWKREKGKKKKKKIRGGNSKGKGKRKKNKTLTQNSRTPRAPTQKHPKLTTTPPTGAHQHWTLRDVIILIHA